MSVRNAGLALPATLVVLWSGCSSNGGRPDATDGGCEAGACAEWCRSQGAEGGRCEAGVCVCTPEPDAGDAGADGDDGRDGNEAEEVEDAGEAEETDEVADSVDTACPCGICGADGGPPELDPDHREGGSPSVVCDRVPIGLNRLVEHYDAEPGVVAFTAIDTPPPSFGSSRLFVYWTTSGERQLVDDLDDLIAAGVGRPHATYPSLDGDWIAYAVWLIRRESGGVESLASELRLARLSTGEIRVLRRYPFRSPGDATYVGPVALDYPWVGWRETEDRWVVHALNVETEQEYLVSDNTVDVTIVGTTLATANGDAIILFDLATGATTLLADGLPNDRWHPALAWPWVVWVDQRAGLWWEGRLWSCMYMGGCCDNDIYGYNRVTGEEMPFVVGRGMQGGEVTAEGDWAAYQDNRDGFEPLCREMGCTQIYALHLPTGREIRVTNWPGEYLEPVVYAGRVLFSQMTSYMDYQYDLWDCNLAVP